MFVKYSVGNVCDFGTMSMISDLEYLPLYFGISIVALVGGVVFLILFLVDKFAFIKPAVMIALMVVSGVAVLGSGAYVAVDATTGYPDTSYQYDSFRGDKPADYDRLFPYSDRIESESGGDMYWSLSSTAIKDSVYTSSQIYDSSEHSGEYDGPMIDVDCFDTTNKRLLVKCIYEKEQKLLANGSGNPDDIKHGSSDGVDYKYVVYDDELHFNITTDTCCFTVSVFHMDMTEDELIDFSLKQYDLFTSLKQ